MRTSADQLVFMSQFRYTRDDVLSLCQFYKCNRIAGNEVHTISRTVEAFTNCLPDLNAMRWVEMTECIHAISHGSHGSHGASHFPDEVLGWMCEGLNIFPDRTAGLVH
jgi:hypothetical protein